MSLNDKLLKAAATSGITPSEHFGVVLYEGDGSSAHSINGGKFGAAAYTADSGVVTLPDNVIDVDNHSVSIWFYANNLSGEQHLMEFDETNRIIFRISSPNNNDWCYVGNSGYFDHGLRFNTGQWYHIVITFSNGNPFKIYRNGSLEYTGGNTSLYANNSNNDVGAGSSTGGVCVEGKIDQLRIFHKELSASEVSTLYAETADTVESLDPLSEDTTDTLQVLGDSSCIALYKFENNEDDKSGNHNGTGAEIQYAAGRYGQAASFNNTADSKMVIGAQNSVIPNNTTGVSFSFWVYLNTVNTGSDYDHWFVGQENYGGSFENGEFSVRLYEGKVYTDYAQSSSIYRQRRASTTLGTNRWYHIVATYDTSNANITEVYLNGVSETSSNLTSGGTFTTTALMQNSTNISVGAGPSGTDGRIDQFRIFTKVLSASEVTTLYEENALVASYRFEGNALDDMRTYDGTPTNITYEHGVNFTPDFVWIKNRDTARGHNLFDSSRGVNKVLFSSSTSDEGSETAGTSLSSFDTGGFTVGSGNGVNEDGDNFVAWCWKANGGTTSSNTDGSITGTVQANTDAGFSIVQYDSSGNSSGTIGHGLGIKPGLVINKNRDTASTVWVVNTDEIDGSDDYLILNTTAAKGDAYIAPTATTIGSIDYATNDKVISYCFASIDGFSKIGSYAGTGATQSIETGFEVEFLLIKGSSFTTDWMMYDKKRSGKNYLIANSTAAEGAAANPLVTFLSNGFQVHTSNSENKSGETFIYMAFAADPDTEAPAVAKSFSTVAYTGNATSNRAITGLGFQPNFVWIKNRSSARDHMLFDSLRVGSTIRGLYANDSAAQFTATANDFNSFDSDGFTIGQDPYTNENNSNMVAWAWKADDNEPTIFGGDAKAVYKFQDNANDVTGNYNGTASNVSYVTGKFGKAADFNGTNSAFTFSNTIYDHNSDHSISFWLNPDTYASDEMIYWGEDDNIRWNSDGTIVYKRYSLANGNRRCDSTTVLSAGTWYHIVATYSTSSGMALYINGEREATHSGTQNADSTSGDYGIMHRVDNSSSYSDGQVDQLRIYNGVVSDIGVAALYAETASDNDDTLLGGPPETIISANANAGFSIVKWGGDDDENRVVPHGLSSTPEMIMVKNLDASRDWVVWHTSLDTGKNVALNATAAQYTVSSQTSYGGLGAPTASGITFIKGNSNLDNVNDTGANYIAYCFHSISGYSKFGYWQGGTTSINIGFRADFVLYQDFGAGGSWTLVDSVRGDDVKVLANTNGAESSQSLLTITDTGFTVTSESAVVKRLYMAFKIN
jgi:hypothetical protein